MPTRPRTEAVVCKECGGYFTPLGLRMHEGTNKCNLNKRARPLTESVEKERKRMEGKGKVPVVKNVATALFRRNLEHMSGLEKADTKLLHTDIDCTVLEEFWVHEWVYKIWEQHNRTGYTRDAYSKLEKLNELSKEERDREIGLILLNLYG